MHYKCFHHYIMEHFQTLYAICCDWFEWTMTNLMTFATIKKQIKLSLKSNQTSLCLFVIYLRVLSNILCHTEPIINLAAVTKSQLDEHVVYVIMISLKATFKSTFSISSDLSIRYKLKVLLESLIKWTAWFYENNNIKRCLYGNALMTLHMISTFMRTSWIVRLFY